MKRSSFVIAVATVLLGSTALAQQPSMQLAIAQPTSAQPSTGVVSTTSDTQADSANRDSTRPGTNRSDARFLKDFAQLNAAKVDTGKLAEWKAEYAEVKAFATSMVDAHTKAIAKIATVAAQTNIDVRAKPDFMQKTKSNILDMSVGTSFDRAYMKSMVKDHDQIVEMLEREIKEGQDPSVKQLASEALADVQQHFKMALELRAKVVADQDANRLARNNSGSAQKLVASR